MTAPQRLSQDERVPAAGRSAEQANGASGTEANGSASHPSGQQSSAGEGGRGPTAAQFRRFIKSRAYVPLHELRRRFELNGDFDDVAPIDGPEGCHVYVGLPPREAQFISELACSGDIGLELSHDPTVPIVVGVYAMRPVSRS